MKLIIEVELPDQVEQLLQTDELDRLQESYAKVIRREAINWANRYIDADITECPLTRQPLPEGVAVRSNTALCPVCVNHNYSPTLIFITPKGNVKQHKGNVLTGKLRRPEDVRFGRFKGELDYIYKPEQVAARRAQMADTDLKPILE